MIALGIDPGRKGAIAVLDTVTDDLAVYDMPDTIPALQALFLSLPPVDFCILEKPFYPAACGTRNVSVMAENYGILKASLAWRDIPIREVSPKRWKGALGLSKDKGASRRMACDAFPAASGQFARVKDDGRAEAALLAHWGRS